MGYVQRGVAVDTWWLSSCCFELRQGVDQREGLAGTGSGFLAWQNEDACHCEECKNEAYYTLYSQAVTHPGTDRALCCWTSQIGRDGVCSTWCGHKTLFGRRAAVLSSARVLTSVKG